MVSWVGVLGVKVFVVVAGFVFVYGEIGYHCDNE